MKYLLLFLIPLTSLASELEQCRQFVQVTLKPAVVSHDGAENHPFRFVKEEAKALSYITDYTPKKLGFAYDRERSLLGSSDCKVLMDKSFQDSFCGSHFSNYQFLRALIHGIKSFGWKASTTKLATEKILSYFKASNDEQAVLLAVAIDAELLRTFAVENNLKAINLQKLQSLIDEMKKSSEALSASFKDNQEKSCQVIQRIMKEEQLLSVKFRKQLGNFITAL